MKKQLIDYILKQKIVNLNVVNSLVDDSTFSGGNSIFWNGETTNLVQAMFINEDNPEESSPLEIYCISDFTFSSLEELKNKTFCVVLENKDTQVNAIFGGKGDSEIVTLFYDSKNSKNFGAQSIDSAIMFNIQDPGYCCFKFGEDGDENNVEVNVFFEKKGLYFSKVQSDSENFYPFLITDEF